MQLGFDWGSLATNLVSAGSQYALARNDAKTKLALQAIETKRALAIQQASAVAAAPPQVYQQSPVLSTGIAPSQYSVSGPGFTTWILVGGGILLGVLVLSRR